LSTAIIVVYGRPATIIATVALSRPGTVRSCSAVASFGFTIVGAAGAGVGAALSAAAVAAAESSPFSPLAQAVKPRRAAIPRVRRTGVMFAPERKGHHCDGAARDAER
jgi:hypothetical protein